MTVLKSEEVKKIQSVKPIFLDVQKATGVPWQAVAAVWYRESFSVASPKTLGGPFQFDPPLPKAHIASILRRFSKLTSTEIEKFAVRGVDDFETGAYCCAAWLRLKCKPVITPGSPDEVIADAFFGYNGRAYASYSKSPYVMNNYDEEHKNMRLKGSIPDGKGGRTWVNIIDKRPGALTIYKFLKDEEL